jgi:CRISPR/Cas system CSM-associated protein Csm3 (group 7 of RAMP superfamily)
MEFVRTRHALHGETVYLPGTSLKGAMRSHAERVLRGLGIQICDPFDDRSRCRKGPAQQERAGDRRGDRRLPPTNQEIFSVQCPACQTFGSLRVAGRCNVEDAYPWHRETGEGADAANATETRWQVGIDRRTGQAQNSALFDLEVAVAGTFRTTIHLDNFALWQLGLLGALIEDMKHGDLPIGFGKTRGLGQVDVEVEGLKIEALGRSGRTLAGAGALCLKGEAESYGLDPGDAMELPSGVETAITWRGRKLALESAQATGFLAGLIASPLQRWVEARAASGGTP